MCLTVTVLALSSHMPLKINNFYKNKHVTGLKSFTAYRGRSLIASGFSNLTGLTQEL